MVVGAQVAANNLKEFVELARASRPPLAFGSPGRGNPSHINIEQFKDAAKVDLLHVPYKGAAPAVQDLLGGQVPSIFTTLSTALPHFRSGKLKALAATTPQRIGVLPDVHPRLLSVNAGEPGDRGKLDRRWRPGREPVDLVHEEGDQAGVELRPAVAPQLVHRLADRPGRAVDAAPHDRVVRVRDRDDPGAQRDLLPRDPVRVATTIPPLVVVADGRPRRCEVPEPGDDAGALHGVGTHHLPLVRGEGAGLEQDRVGHADLADIVHGRGQRQHPHPLGIEPEPLGDESKRLGFLGADLARTDKGWEIVRILPGETSEPAARSPLPRENII